MPVIRLETLIAAPIETCFDMARDVDLHQRSTAASAEKVVAGVTSGRMELGDEVTWEATHFGVRQPLSSRITAFDRPNRFVDEMVRGAFARFRHTHDFMRQNAGTLMVDVFDYTSPLGVVGRLADFLFLRRYMTRLLQRRNAYLKSAAESPL